jgi:enoyl-CoA hydratase/carnithine racemase
MESPEWRQLYVNAEHDGTVGVVTIGRESLNGAVIDELNRAFDWLKSEGVPRVILTGDFHLATQMVGADTAEFYPALGDATAGERLSLEWSRTARRLEEDFEVSVGFVNGKRCLGGMLELMVHCHYLVAVEDARLGFPEVTLPVIPGMEGCHWPFRKTTAEHWPRLLGMLLGGAPVKAKDASGWLVDFAGDLEASLVTAWKLASDRGRVSKRRAVDRGALTGVPRDVAGLPEAEPATAAARAAIMECVQRACGAPLADSLGIQAKMSGAFFTARECRAGRVGQEYSRTMEV